ncbi:MAG: aminotransferase class V-fold PLP-dependent enzyme [Alistipes sp.]|nr:aminotransferase class V-fold PLP-dependent enzyme [Alistipes sp.]
MLYFDSDYMAGAHPEVMQRLIDTNSQHTVGYGCDQYSLNAIQLIKEACGVEDAKVYLLVGGTQTNATVIDGLLAPHQGVLAAQSGHICVHEAGAIEASGHKILTLPQYNGKVKAADVEEYIVDFYRDETFLHMVAPGALYISFPTEYGTIYTLSELQEISRVCREHSIPLYIDGARLGYGLNAEGCDVTLKDIAKLCDVFYIGGTKMGALFGEAVVVTNSKLLNNFYPLIKQHGAMLAKGRLLGVQFEALFTDDLYNRVGRQCVELAIKLKRAFINRGYTVEVDSPTNQQFFRLPNSVIDRLKEHASFEMWGPKGKTESVVRFVTGWATTESDIDRLIELL